MKEPKLKILTYNKSSRLSRYTDGIDISRDITSVAIEHNAYEKSTISLVAPIEELQKKWINDIKARLEESANDNMTIIFDSDNRYNYFIIDTMQVDTSDNKEKNKLTLLGSSIESVLDNRLNIQKEYLQENLSNILRDIIQGAGLVEFPNDDYPFDLDGNETSRLNRQVSNVALEINFAIDPVLDFETNESTMSSESVTTLLKRYGKTMYSIIDEDEKFKIIIKDGSDKTFVSTSRRYLLSPEDNTLNSIQYVLDRNERVNVLAIRAGDNETSYKISENIDNPAIGINRIESYVNLLQNENEDTTEQETDFILEMGEESLEKVNITATLGREFNFGDQSNEIFVGDLLSVLLWEKDENNERVVVDIPLASISIVIEKGSTENVSFIPKLGIDEKDELGNPVTVRQSINSISMKSMKKSYKI